METVTRFGGILLCPLTRVCLVQIDLFEKIYWYWIRYKYFCFFFFNTSTRVKNSHMFDIAVDRLHV